MNRKLLFALSGLILSGMTQAQFTAADIKFWVGSGTDSTMLVVDFNDGTMDSSYAWGYLHNGTATGTDMLNAIAAADVNFSVNMSGSFISDIFYISHEGVGGSPDYWSTWDGSNVANLDTNAGMGAPLISGGWFGLSYTDFDPALKPGEPVAAFDPDAFGIDDATFFVGSGSDTALLVIDFFDFNQPSSFAWGYLFNDSTTGGEMLQDVSAADTLLDVVISGGFLDDITYQSMAGIAGSPNYWTTWSATNYGNWQMNSGISTVVKPGDFFGTSYIGFGSYSRPEVPAAAVNPVSLNEFFKQDQIKVFPQPASDQVFVELPESKSGNEITLYGLKGEKLISTKISSSKTQLDISGLAAGVYILKCNNISRKIVVR